jgi:hypothetical protein
MPNISTADLGGGDDGGGRNDLLAAIQRGTSLKKVTDPESKEGKAANAKRRATIAAPSSGGGDLMSALKERMNLRRKGISGARKDEEDLATADAPAKKPPMARSMTMPMTLPSMAEDDDNDAPISMSGMASALKAAASNRPASDDDSEWSDDD